MAILEVVNVLPNLILIPRVGLMGAVPATATGCALGLVASGTLGRRAIALPLLWDVIGRAGVSTACMALAVSRLPALGGLAKLAFKATVDVVVYGSVVLDAGGVRGRSARLVRALHARRPGA
jgi:O-antigen/teichoic acid export membrane protein